MTPLVDQCKTLALPTPFRILGRVLEPLCIGHMALFERLDIKGCSDLDQLMLLVNTCAYKPSQLPKAMARWFTKIEWAVWGWRCRRLLRNEVELNKRLELVAEYLDLHTKVPDSFIQQSHEEAETKIPFNQWLRVALLANLNYDPATIDDMPYRQAVIDLMTFQEQQGAIEMADGYRGENAEAMFEAANRAHELRMKGGLN